LTPNPLDLLSSDIEHGTLEGERAGCVTSACPGAPLTCAEVAGSYRRDIRFKRLYTSGLRGQELLDVYQERPLTSTPVVQAAAGPFELSADWADLGQEDRDSALLAWDDEGLTFKQIAEKVGSTAPGIASAFRAARKRAAAAANSTPEPAPEVDPLPAAGVVARFGVPPMKVADIPGPQMIQAWVVLDHEKRVLFATEHVDEAVPALAEAWKRHAEARSAS